MTATGSRTRQAALRDPMRSAGGLHVTGRLRRGVAEFLRLPLLMIFAFCVAGVLVALLDASADERAPLREIAAALVPDEGSIEFVSAVATSVVTVTSITFSVLLLAVQQTSQALTAVVFDQFLRRTANQVYFGFFVGTSAFCFLILGPARRDPAPVYGAAITLVLAVVALVILLLLIHGTIDQMRPQSVVRSIHELALRARERELVLLCRTRAERTSEPSGRERGVTVYDSGYVVSVDVDALARVAAEAGDDVEIIVRGALGDYLVFGDVTALIAGVDADDDSWDDAVREAFELNDIRDVDVEMGYATGQLNNIAWAASSSSQQSPQTAITAVRALRDLLARCLAGGERDRVSREDLEDGEDWQDREGGAGRPGEPSVVPVVYVDGAASRIVGALAAVVIATAESRQVHTCAETLRAFTGTIARLRTERDRAVVGTALDSVLPAVIQHAEAPELAETLRELERVLREHDYDVSRVAQVRDLLSQATARLLPKASDEPQAAHPR
ncbi:DUF2254 family protein [Planobispora siamensis]|uniref:DUF2254 domain-containing protein n=1 Tax=Planobispora siamensis TaxID=936338 RepID=A0A8J3SKM8_9ACTN|nr:DUF2254 family protein [Planobispora siamensis]GIH96206.1 hypothetical protein Psi01_68360 [Planobispora siamensis]